MDFSRLFIFEPPDFFADFLVGFFLLIFVGKKCPEKSSKKIPGKILQNLYNKNPRHISAEGAGPKILLSFGRLLSLKKAPKNDTKSTQNSPGNLFRTFTSDICRSLVLTDVDCFPCMLLDKKKKENPGKKTRFLLFAEPSNSLESGENAQKKQRFLQKEKN